MTQPLTKGTLSGGKERREAKDPRRQIVGIVGMDTLTLIIGQENIERAFDIDGKNRRISQERRQG